MFVGGGGGINAIALDMPTYKILASLLGLEPFKKSVVVFETYISVQQIKLIE